MEFFFILAGSMTIFTYRMQVFSEDTDSFGIVHHANYIKFMERARLDGWFKLGFRLDELFAQGLFLVIKKIDIDYILPARLYDQLEIISKIVMARRVSKVYEQIIRSAVDPTIEFCRATMQVVCVNDKLKPYAMPPELLENLQ